MESLLKENLRRGLPGEEAQYRMVPGTRKRLSLQNIDHAKVRHAAVLALFENRAGEAYILLTRRQKYRGVHSGQLSLPGGKREAYDRDYRATALRETHEEVGVAPESVVILSALSELYIPPSNFYVYPFLGLSPKAQKTVAQESEVRFIHRIAAADLLHPAHEVQREVRLSQGYKMTVPAFEIEGLLIWGATAMILGEIKALLQASP